MARTMEVLVNDFSREKPRIGMPRERGARLHREAKAISNGLHQHRQSVNFGHYVRLASNPREGLVDQ